MRWNSFFGNLTTGASVLAIVATAGGACYVISGSAPCCVSYHVTCQNGEDPPLYWSCPQDSNANGWNINQARNWQPGDTCMTGTTGLGSTLAGSCKMTYRLCGATVGVCIPQSPIDVECHHADPSGTWCPTCP